MLVQDVRTYALRCSLLTYGDRILVAVSGGPDSVALLNILYELKDELGLHLEVAHLQHGIRGEEAKGDAKFVAELAEKLELPFHLKETDLPRMKSAAGKGNVEALARAERYRFFAEVVRKHNLNKVATAHTQDDQAETVLMWFLRGTGMKGFGGMAPRRQLDIAAGDSTDTLTVIRPLLEVSKSEILESLKERNLAYRIDQSNQDPTFLRNWIRAELLPKIQQRVGTGFSARLSHLAELLRDEDAFLEEVTRQRYDAIRIREVLRRRALLGEPPAVRRRILRHWIEQARGHLRGLDFAHIDALLRLIEEGPPQGRLSIPSGWELVRQYETLKLEKLSRGLKPVRYSYQFEIGTTLRVFEAGIEFQSERITGRCPPLPSNLMEVVFDAGCLTRPLWVRNFLQGDRFQPLGMSGRKKIKDLFIEHKVPLSTRVQWPLLTMGDMILWIPAYGRSEVGRVTGQTERVLSIKATPIET
jgi:tRNA(Ile)-lysidine synthase